MNFIKGKVWSKGEYYSYLGFENGIIKSIGNESPPEYEDLSSLYIYPGFIDSHMHFLYHGLNLIRCSLNNARSPEDIYERIRLYAADNGGRKFIIADGFDETAFDNEEMPDGNVLNEMFPDIPVIIRRICGHVGVINRQAYQLMKDDITEYDSMKQIMMEGPILRLNDFFPEDRQSKIRAMRKAEQDLFSKGITSIGDIATSDSPALYEEFETDLDIFFYLPYEYYNETFSFSNRSNIRFKGLKIFADGSVGGRTAAFSMNYLKSRESGALLLTDSQLKGIVEIAEKDGLQTTVHAIGDRAIEQALKILPAQNRIEHFEFPTEDQIKKTAERNIYVSLQPNFIGNWGQQGGMYQKRLPSALFKRNNPYREIVKVGIKAGFGSDDMPVSPIYGIGSVLNAPFDSQSISIEKAVELYTNGSSDIMNEKSGILDTGRPADFTAMSKPFDEYVTGDKMPEIISTYKKGRKVFNREV
ncbi:MAG: amidohydrolase family protein [candidate division WOR-3 bacterium]|nr:amidohydrolase family protein [candidate division WOR-3 bacterium]